MAISDDMFKRKMLEIETAKAKALCDIRDVLLINNVFYGLEIEAKAQNGDFAKDNIKVANKHIAEIRTRIEERNAEC